jgi:hypothetical protein
MIKNRHLSVNSTVFDPEGSFIRVLLHCGPSACPLTTPGWCVSKLLGAGLIARCGRELTGRGWKPAYRIPNRAAAESWLGNRDLRSRS